MNKQDPNVRFSPEAEKNSGQTFLDLKICRENRKFVSIVSRKETFSVYTNFISFIPLE